MEKPTFIDAGIEQVYQFIKGDMPGFMAAGARAYAKGQDRISGVTDPLHDKLWKQSYDEAATDERYRNLRAIALIFK